MTTVADLIKRLSEHDASLPVRVTRTASSDPSTGHAYIGGVIEKDDMVLIVTRNRDDETPTRYARAGW